LLSINLGRVNLLLLRSLNLVFYFIISNSFNLSGLSNHIGNLLLDIFSFLYGNIFNFFNGNSFFNGVINSSGNVFFLIFNCLIIDNFFGFGNYSGNNSRLRNNFFNRNGNFFFNNSFNFIIFNMFGLIRNIFNSRISFNGLILRSLSNLRGHNLRSNNRLLNLRINNRLLYGLLLLLLLLRML